MLICAWAVVCAGTASAGESPGEREVRWYHGRRVYDRRIDLRPDAPRAPEIPAEERIIPTPSRDPIDEAPVDSALFRPSQPAPPPPPRRPTPRDEETDDPAAWLLEPMTADQVGATPSFSGWGWLAEKVITERDRGAQPNEANEDDDEDDAASELYSLLFGEPDPSTEPMEFGLIGREPGRTFGEEDRTVGDRQWRSDDSRDIDAAEDRPDSNGAPQTPGLSAPPDELAGDAEAARLVRERHEADMLRSMEAWSPDAPGPDRLPAWRDMLPGPEDHLSAPLDPTVRAWLPDRTPMARDSGSAPMVRPADPEPFPATARFDQNGEFPALSGSRAWDPFERGQMFTPGYEPVSPAGDFASSFGGMEATDPLDLDTHTRSTQNASPPNRDSVFPEEPVFHW